MFTLALNAIVLLRRAHYELLIMTPLAPDQTRIDLRTMVPNPGPEGHSEKSNGYWQTTTSSRSRPCMQTFGLGNKCSGAWPPAPTSSFD